MVTRAEFESALPIGSMVTQVLTRLLAFAADKSGRIAHYEPGEIFDTHILAAMEMEPDDVTTAIRYDTWTAMVMSESVFFFVNAGFLAHRGGGDHAAYHLALPNAGLTGTRSFYRSYSAVLHGQLYGLMNFMTPAIQADGSILLSWQLRGSVLYGAVEVALLSFREPFKRINQHMGWGRLEYDLWHARTARALNMVTRRGAWHLQTAMSATAAGGTGTGPGPG